MNRIIVVPGANDLVSATAAAAAVERLRPTVVVGQFEIPQAVTGAAFAAARRIGAITILSPAPGAPIDPTLLAMTDWLVPNETEFVAVGGAPLAGDPSADDRAIDALGRELGVSLVVTLGEHGVALLPRAGLVDRVPAPVVSAVDTTGAGDAFVGSFAVGLAAGLVPHGAAALGCAAAADSVTRPGTQSSYPAPDEAERLLADAVRRSDGPGPPAG